MTDAKLVHLGITPRGFLRLKPDLDGRSAETTSLGQDKLWSSSNLRRHLDWLEELITRTVCNYLSNTCNSHTLSEGG